MFTATLGSSNCAPCTATANAECVKAVGANLVPKPPLCAASTAVTFSTKSGTDGRSYFCCNDCIPSSTSSNTTSTPTGSTTTTACADTEIRLCAQAIAAGTVAAPVCAAGQLPSYGARVSNDGSTFYKCCSSCVQPVCSDDQKKACLAAVAAKTVNPPVCAANTFPTLVSLNVTTGGRRFCLLVFCFFPLAVDSLIAQRNVFSFPPTFFFYLI